MRSALMMWILIVLMLLISGGRALADGGQVGVSYDIIPPLPDREGFAGMFAGCSNGALIATGGTNFPEKRVWEGGRKAWYDTIYVLEAPSARWRVAQERFPSPRAYGVSATYKDALICCGGGDADRYYDQVLSLRWKDGHVQISRLPSLPQPCATMCGAVVGDVLYIAGGVPSADSTRANHSFWALDLSKDSTEQKWIELPPWPGPERHEAIAASAGGSFYLLSGVRLEADEKGKPRRIMPLLRDVYRFRPDRGQEGALGGQWKRLADMPRAAIAAPSPAPVLEERYLVVTGGGDDEEAGYDFQHYPGLNTGVLVYDLPSDRWSVAGHLAAKTATVAAPVTFCEGRWLIVGGEVAPSVRTNRIGAVVSQVAAATEQSKSGTGDAAGATGGSR